MSGFKRKVNLDPSYAPMDGKTPHKLSLFADGASYSYSISGKITDQYHSNLYQPMDYFSPPTFSVSSGNKALDRYILYTSELGYEIDINGLRKYVQKTGQGNFSYTATFSFPTATTKGVTSFTQSVQVNTSQLNANKASLYATGTAQSDYTVTADKVDTGAGESVTVPVKLQGSTPIWGILANVEFDTDALEFVGFDNNGVFAPAEFTTQNDLTKSSFKFLAANDELENVTADGTLINLKFKVKEDASAQAYNIGVNVLQSVNVDGEVNTIDTSNGWVNVTEPTTAPPTTESTEPTTDAPATEETEPAVTEPTDSEPTEATTEKVIEKATENVTEQKPTEQSDVVIPDGDRNSTFNMILMFIALCSAGAFVALRKREI